MIAAWSLLAFNPFLRASHLVIGTDPVMSVLVAIPWKFVHPRIRIAHWCFDLYPEAAFADRMFAEGGAFAKALMWLLGVAYRRCDLVADLGLCMKTTLAKYLGSSRPARTIPIWAIVEPDAPVPVDDLERRHLFGNTKLAFLYSGNLGRAHSFGEVFDLARQFTTSEAVFVFSIRGNRSGELVRAMSEAPSNMKMANFASIEALEKRLAATDVHIVTLRSEWTGAVVPSKFFGAIAAGRPVLFIGSASSGIAKWIEEFKVGWVINTDYSSATTYQLQITRIVRELKGLAEDSVSLRNLFGHCHSVYQANFSKQRILDQWNQELLALSSSAESSSS